MPRSAPIRWVRIAALALVGLAGPCLDARPARAGCHVAEKPTFGLSRFDEIVPGFGLVVASVRAPSQVAPRPCSDEIPGGLRQQNPLGLVALMPPAPIVLGPPATPLRPVSASARPIHSPDGLDRPPRPRERTA